MDAALRHGGDDQLIRLAIVERAGGEWVGVLPLVQRARFGRWPVPHWQGWLATNQFLGSPLVRPGAEDRFWALLLPFLDVHAGREIGQDRKSDVKGKSVTVSVELGGSVIIRIKMQLSTDYP